MTLSVARLREVLDYEPVTGIFTWRVRTSKRVHVGDIANSCRADGYVRISIDGTRHYAHRLAWVYTHGVWPVEEIDHRDGNPNNNRLVNLREASPSFNRQNLRHANKNNASNFLGVCWCKRNKKWRAQIKVNGKHLNLGDFPTPEEAHEAYLTAKRQLHPGNTL